MMPAADAKRLFASLMASCLLHATLVFMPYLGASNSTFRPAVQGEQKLKPPRTLSAMLALEKRSAITVADVTADEGTGAKLSAERRPNEEPRPALERALGIGVLPIPAPSYYTTDRLTKRPQPTAEPQLDTAETWPIPASGTIVLKLWISELGEVVSVDVEKTDLPEIFSKAAVAAFRHLRFVPGELNGRRVGTMMRIEVTYGDGRMPQP